MQESRLSEQTIPFSLVYGGAFHSVLNRLGLLDADRLPTWRTAAALALLAWLPPALLAGLQSLLQPDYTGWGYFTDATVYTRYLIAIFVMVVTERIADARISRLVNQFPRARLLNEVSEQEFLRLIGQADRQASRPQVEAVLLLVALLWSWLSFWLVTSISVSGWEEWSAGGEAQLSWAGTMAELLGNPIFLFLLFRWLWRFGIWSLLLYRISRLGLRLVATHPDRAGGLGFLSLFPGMFTGLVFALSCVVSSSLLKTMTLMSSPQLLIWFSVFGWLLLMTLIFLGPLFLFSPSLFRLREDALIEYGRLAQLHHRAFHKAWIEDRRDPLKLVGSPDPGSVADLNTAVETALSARIVPLDLPAAFQTLIAAALPFLVVVASQIPLTQVLRWVLGAIF